MAGSSVSRASLRAAGMPRVRKMSEALLSDRLRNGCRAILRVPAQAGASGETELQEESRNGSGPCAGFMWETDRADTGSERIRQRSGRKSSFDHAFPGIFPYAREFRSGGIRQDKPGAYFMKTWLITGCSSGLGKGLAEAVLEHGDQAVVTARRPETLRHFTDRYPETALALPLDVSDDTQAEAAVKAALARFGRVDVLASVAGYCLRGAVEECSMDEIHRQFETNFFGTVRMIRKVLPSMRAVRNGAIVCFSSIAAAGTSPGSAFYGATKCAVEAMADGLRKEVNPLGIRVIVAEPGPFRTDFFDRSINISAGNISDYRDTAGNRKIRVTDLSGDTPLGKWGDVMKAGRVVIEAVEGEKSPFRLPLGSAAVRYVTEQMNARLAEIRAWQDLSVRTDAD